MDCLGSEAVLMGCIQWLEEMCGPLMMGNLIVNLIGLLRVCTSGYLWGFSRKIDPEGSVFINESHDGCLLKW